MAGIVPPKLKTLLDLLRYADLEGELGERIRVLIDEVEAEITEVLQRPA